MVGIGTYPLYLLSLVDPLGIFLLNLNDCLRRLYDQHARHAPNSPGLLLLYGAYDALILFVATNVINHVPLCTVFREKAPFTSLPLLPRYFFDRCIPPCLPMTPRPFI